MTTATQRIKQKLQDNFGVDLDASEDLFDGVGEWLLDVWGIEDINELSKEFDDVDINECEIEKQHSFVGDCFYKTNTRSFQNSDCILRIFVGYHEEYGDIRVEFGVDTKDQEVLWLVWSYD